MAKSLTDIEWVIGKRPEIKGDPIMLREALINLISNALKYTRRRQHTRIKIGSTSNEHEIVCFVHDNGSGFDMQFAPKHFGVFQRLHSEKDFPGKKNRTDRRSPHHSSARRTGWAEGVIDLSATFYFFLPKI